MTIFMSAEHGIGWCCWSVFASVSGVAARKLDRELTKQQAKWFVRRVERLISSQEASFVPEGCRLKLAHSGGRGHGHWSLVWDVQAGESSAVLDADLPLQIARKRRDALNAILADLYELRFTATAINHLNGSLSSNASLVSQGTGPAVDALLKVNEELKQQLFQLQCGRPRDNECAA